ncbi:sporulation protein YqfD [Metabacillus idriensis]|uniref:sporulation protein YqfD n=1 Tax=Metabacillus idriensis TaxID=324768 RepID=UPI001639B3CA|nr:sporulation protein YqfD [Metabacillus idriensis]QNG61173.1 sporulation protein YqfD [Bacillus sp. PAMC26568]
MKNQWINFFYGIVKVTIRGKGMERFINDCIRNDIPVWNVRREEESLSFFIRLKDVHAIRSVARKNECKCYLKRKAGLPFLIQRSLKNSGFIIGFGLFFIVILLLSNMVWGIDIKGAKPSTEHLIKKELDAMGVKVGKLQFFIDDPDTIQRKLTNNIQELTWVGVELIGTNYHLEVVEKNEPEKITLSGPQHIVAKKKAIITKMYVEQGQPAVTIHEHVREGQILVSGFIGNEKNQQKVAAKAEIFGETWYRAEVIKPIETTFNVFSGKDKRKYYLKLGSFHVPVWGFNQEIFPSFEMEDDVRTVKFLKWSLPLGYVKEIYREKEVVKRSYSINEAKEAALNDGKKELQQKLGDEAEIKGQKVLHQSSENGKVKLIVLYQVIENIVKTTPIVQGD